MNDIPKRKRNRLDGDLYRLPGAYFITICTECRKNLFWRENHADSILCLPFTSLGKVVEEEILKIGKGTGMPLHVDKYVVMPNHVHMILLMEDSSEQAIPDIRFVVRYFKRQVSQRAGFSVWQKGFHDHIVRNDGEYREIWKYIDENPIKWNVDRYYLYADKIDLQKGDEDIAPTP